MEAFLMEVAKVGYGKTQKEVKLIAEAVAREKGVLRGEKISDGLFHRFLERRPNLNLRRGDATANVRMKALDIEKMNEYFKSLEETLKQRPNQGRFTMWMKLVSHLITALQMSLQEEAQIKFVIESLGIRGRLLLLGVLMQLVRQSLLLSYLMQNA